MEKVSRSSQLTQESLKFCFNCLAYPRANYELIMDNKASSVELEGVSLQLQDDKQVVANFSKTVSKAEKNYCGTRRTLLVIVK